MNWLIVPIGLFLLLAIGGLFFGFWWMVSELCRVASDKLIQLEEKPVKIRASTSMVHGGGLVAIAFVVVGFVWGGVHMYLDEAERAQKLLVQQINEKVEASVASD